MTKRNVKDNQRPLMMNKNAPQATDMLKNAGNQPDFSSLVIKESAKIIGRSRGVQEEILRDNALLGRSLCDRGPADQHPPPHIASQEHLMAAMA